MMIPNGRKVSVESCVMARSVAWREFPGKGEVQESQHRPEQRRRAECRRSTWCSPREDEVEVAEQ